MRSSANLYIPLVVLPGVVLVQTSFLSRLQIGGFRLDLVLLVVVSWSLTRGTREGMYWGFIGGGLVGLFSVVPLGTHMLAMTLAGFVAGVGEQNVFRQNPLLSLGITVVATATYYFTSMLLLHLLGWNIAWMQTSLTVVLPITLFNVLAVPVVYRLMQPLRRLTGPPELSW